MSSATRRLLEALIPTFPWFTTNGIVGISKDWYSHQLNPNLDSARLLTRLSIAPTSLFLPLPAVTSAHTTYVSGPTLIPYIHMYRQRVFQGIPLCVHRTLLSSRLVAFSAQEACLVFSTELAIIFIFQGTNCFDKILYDIFFKILI